MTALGVVGEADRPSARASLKTPFESQGPDEQQEHLTAGGKENPCSLPVNFRGRLLAPKKAKARSK